MQCILSNVIVRSTGLLKLFHDHPNINWEHVNNIPSRPLTSITKGPENAVTCNFTNSLRPDMGFRHCLSLYCFTDQVVTRCMGVLIKGPWFSFAHTEIGGSDSFFSLNGGRKTWCASTLSTSARFFERFGHSA